MAKKKTNNKKENVKEITTPQIEEMRKKLKNLVKKYNMARVVKRKNQLYNQIITLDWEINLEQKKLEKLKNK